MPQMPGNSSCRRPSAVTTWVTGGTIQPGADDFTMLWLLIMTFRRSAGSC